MKFIKFIIQKRKKSLKRGGMGYSGLCCASGYVIGPVDYDGVFKNYACYKASEVPSAVSCNVIWKSDGDFTPATSEQCEDVTDFSVAMRDVNYCPNGMSGWKKRTLADQHMPDSYKDAPEVGEMAIGWYRNCL